MTEREIIELMLQRDEEGMYEFLRRYGPLLRYIIASILPNAQDREDCLLETLMLIWDKIDLFDNNRGGWNVWITSVARNRARSFKRRIPAQTEEIPEDMPSLEPTPEEATVLRERLRWALESMASTDLDLICRKYYYSQSIAQIASETGMTEKAVESRLYRLRRRLRRILDGEGFEKP